MVKVLYFARLRESLGISGEDMELAQGITVGSLMAQLAARGDAWGEEFDGCRLVRAAVNQILVPNSTEIQADDEVAFFPPVTGG